MVLQESGQDPSGGAAQQQNVPLPPAREQRIIQQLNSVKPTNARALILIINSYGGSLRAAKNISHAIDELRAKEYRLCELESQCIASRRSSASTAPTSSSHQAPAVSPVLPPDSDKLSILGDFGYVYENYAFDDFNKRYNVGLETVSNAESKIEAVSKLYQFKDGKFITKLVGDRADELKLEVLANRIDELNCKNIAPSTFEAKILRGGTVNPH